MPICSTPMWCRRRGGVAPPRSVDCICSTGLMPSRCIVSVLTIGELRKGVELTSAQRSCCRRPSLRVDRERREPLRQSCAAGRSSRCGSVGPPGSRPPAACGRCPHCRNRHGPRADPGHPQHARFRRYRRRARQSVGVSTMPAPSDVEARFRAEAAKRILVLDGAMGTMIQSHRFSEADFRGERFERLAEGSARQQRPAHPDAAGRHPRHPPRLSAVPAPTSSRPTPSPRRASRRPTTAWRTSPSS